MSTFTDTKLYFDIPLYEYRAACTCTSTICIVHVLCCVLYTCTVYSTIVRYIMYRYMYLHVFLRRVNISFVAKIILLALLMALLLRKPPKDDEEAAASRNKCIIPCGSVVLPHHSRRHAVMRTRRGRSLLNRPFHRSTLALDAYRARLDGRVNRLMWDIVSTALFVGVLLATAYVMCESRALQQNLVWRTLLHADLKSPINMVLFIND